MTRESQSVQQPASPHSNRPLPVIVSSRYRCRSHPDELVTWRGHGCTACRDERSKPRRRLTPEQRQKRWTTTVPTLVKERAQR